MWVKHRFCAYEREVFKKKKKGRKKKRGDRSLSGGREAEERCRLSLMEVFLLH